MDFLLLGKKKRKIAVRDILRFEGKSLTSIARKLKCDVHNFRTSLGEQLPDLKKRLIDAHTNTYVRNNPMKVESSPALDCKVYTPGDRGFKKLEDEYKHDPPFNRVDGKFKANWKNSKNIPSVSRHWVE
jgi:hypothetical protein